MNESQVKLPYCSLAVSERNGNEDSFLERRSSPSSISKSLQISPDIFPDLPCALDLFSSRDYFRHQNGGPANAIPDYRIPNFGIDEKGTLARDLQPTISPLAFAARNDGALLRGVANRDEGPRKDFWDLEDGRHVSQLSDCQYNNHIQPSSDLFQSGTAPMESLRLPSARYSPCRSGKSSWTSFRGIFGDSESARKFRKDALRFDREPCRPLDSDPTIWKIENNRQFHVKEIYDAMIRSDAAKDNPKSNAMRRWVEDPFYDSALVEAYAHRIFDCLLSQAKEGFRGWKHDDYTQDERKGVVEDTDVSCEQRLFNIIRALEEEKTICEDVMTSACQIRMFVNAPKAYAGRKLNNRMGNSKRKRAKDPISKVVMAAITADAEETSGPAKFRKPPQRQTKKLRHSSSSVALPQASDCKTFGSEDQEKTVQYHSQYSATSQQFASNLVPSYPVTNSIPGVANRANQYTPPEEDPFERQINTMSPLHIPCIPLTPPQHEPPLLSPLPLSQTSVNSPFTPEQPRFSNMAFDYSQQQPIVNSYAPLLHPASLYTHTADIPLFEYVFNREEANLSHGSGTSSQFQFDETYDPRLFSPSVDSPVVGESFQQIWNAFSGVQQYPTDLLFSPDSNLSGQ